MWRNLWMGMPWYTVWEERQEAFTPGRHVYHLFFAPGSKSLCVCVYTHVCICVLSCPEYHRLWVLSSISCPPFKDQGTMQKECKIQVNGERSHGIRTSWHNIAVAHNSCSCGPQTCRRSSQSKFSHEWGKVLRLHPCKQSYWQLMVPEGERVTLFWWRGCWGVAHTLVDGLACLCIWLALIILKVFLTKSK